MVAVCWHLNALCMRLIDTRALPREELLLLNLVEDSMVNFVSVGTRAFRLCKLRLCGVSFSLSTACLLDLDAAVCRYRALLTAWEASALLWVRKLDVHNSGRRGRNVLRLEHLLLEVLTVTHLALFDGEAETSVVVVAHSHLVRLTMPAA